MTTTKRELLSLILWALIAVVSVTNAAVSWYDLQKSRAIIEQLQRLIVSHELVPITVNPDSADRDLEDER